MIRPLVLAACLALPCAASAQTVIDTTRGQPGPAKGGTMAPAPQKGAPSPPAAVKGQNGAAPAAGMADGKGKGGEGKR